MKGSPFAGIYMSQLTKWEEWIIYTIDFLQLLGLVQATWMYLKPVMSAPDILKHLSV